MRLSRVYVDAPLAPGAAVTLSGSAAAHVSRVLRLAGGDPLTLFNGDGADYAARLGARHGATVTVTVGERSAVERESPLQVTLAQGVSRGERMDFVVQKATELGVARILPVLTARSVVRLEGAQAARRAAHWRAIAIAACEQSGRNRLPQVAEPLTFAQLLAEPAAGARLLLSAAGTQGLRSVPPPGGAVLLLIGPEGGLSGEEEAGALAAGFTAVRLGPRVLRTETAALAALALLQHAFGDL